MRDSDVLQVMEPKDYVLDESFLRTRENHLLDDEGKAKNPALTDPAEVALAKIACVVHENARYLSADQAELAVKWLKKWKLRDALAAELNDVRPIDAFDKRLKALRESPEQVQLQSVANRHATLARVWAAVFVAIVAGMVGMGVTGGFSVAAWAATSVALIGSLIASDRSVVRALVTAKEQDRKYALESLRAATTVKELINAGLCAYIPGVLYEGPNYDEKYALSQMYKERERLADALYLDPDACLDPYSFRDNGPRV
jgi:hypothetical protein